MSEAEYSFLPLRVLRVGVGGKRTFEPEGKRRLIEACRQPDVSLSGMALKAVTTKHPISSTSPACPKRSVSPDHRVTHRAARLPLDISAGGGTVDNPTSQGLPGVNYLGRSASIILAGGSEA